MKELFKEEDMTWKKTILFSIICGVVTGLIALIKPIEKTSIHNIAVCFEAWIFLALFIILKCKTPKDAALKTFVFFLISQPLCYLVQVPFYWDHFGIFRFYSYWFKLTLLTLPGGYVAWYLKKDNIFSMIIMICAIILLSFECGQHFHTLVKSFPYQLIAVGFIIFEVIFFVDLNFKEKSKKTILYTISGILFILSTMYFCGIII